MSIWCRRHWCFPILGNAFVVFPSVAFTVWAICYILFGDITLPGGSLFALGVLEILAIILGHGVDYIKMPPLIGMVTAGLILKNVALIGLADDFDLTILSPLRGMSVAVLLSRGALSVNPSAIKQFKWVVPQLAVGSCVFEAVIGSLLCYFILQFPIPWAALMGCIMSAMSGSAVMPYYLNLEKNGLGLEHGCVQIVKAACGLDAILAINMAELCFGFIFSNGDIATGFQNGLLEVCMGAVYGILWGVLAGLFLNDTHGSILRTFVVFTCGAISLLGFPNIGHPRGGPLGCWLGTLIAATFWRHLQVDGGNNREVSDHCTSLWYIFQPLLFGIIGVRIDFSTVDWFLIERSVLCVLISILFRMSAAFTLVCFAEGMTFREKLFIAIAWTAKGTVQAALGPVALDTALSLNASGFIQEMSYKVMSISVLIMLLASSFGGLLMLHVAPKLLRTGETQPQLVAVRNAV